MKTDGSSVSVIVCGYTLARWRDICEAVSSIEAQSTPPREIIVVVDGNRELEQRLRARFPKCQVIPNALDPGLSGARNTGVRAATGRYVAFLDDDAVAPANWIDRMLKQFSDDRLLGVSTRVVPSWEGSGPPWFPDEFLWVVGCTNKGLQRGPVRNLLGASMCVSRALFDKIGGFDSRLGRKRAGIPMGCEETEFCVRAAAAIPGALFVYDDSATVRHTVGRGRQTWRYFLSRCFAEGLSKSRFAGRGNGEVLSTERHYVRSTLTKALAQALRQGALSLDPNGFLRAGAILGGLVLAASGLLYGRCVERFEVDHTPSATTNGSTVPETTDVRRLDNSGGR